MHLSSWFLCAEEEEEKEEAQQEEDTEEEQEREVEEEEEAQHAALTQDIKLLHWVEPHSCQPAQTVLNVLEAGNLISIFNTFSIMYQFVLQGFKEDVMPFFVYLKALKHYLSNHQMCMNSRL